jgi:hypothetical protein
MFPASFPRCPNLKEVSLTGHYEVDIPLFRDEDLERLDKFAFGHTSGWTPYDILCITLYRNTHMLILQERWIYRTAGQRYGNCALILAP